MDRFSYHHKHSKIRYHHREQFQNFRKKRVFCCVNCGKQGHIYKECSDPITSFGIVAIRSNDDQIKIGRYYNNETKKCIKHSIFEKEENEKNEKNETNENKATTVLYLMVQRKDTMGYVDLIRGKYPEDDLEKKKHLLTTYFEEMTCGERERLTKYDFETLWDMVWLTHENGTIYIKEFLDAQKKFKKLNIKKLLEETTCKWTEQEFGFPKGRKNMYESNMECAKREFKEESGYKSHDLKIIDEEPWEEMFTGTNGIIYRHIYYIGLIHPLSPLPEIDYSDVQQAGEISNYGWFTYEQCMKLIRPYDTAKKDLLTRIHAKWEV